MGWLDQASKYWRGRLREIERALSAIQFGLR
jgi:hypothetical protein